MTTRDLAELANNMSAAAEESDAFIRTPRRPKQSPSQSQPSSRIRRPISPPPLTRPTTNSTPDESITLSVSTPPRPSRGSAQKQARDDVNGQAAILRSGGTAKSGSAAGITPPSSRIDHQIHRTPKHQTPKKTDWTIEKIEDKLRKFSHEIGADGARLSSRLIHMAWKKEAPQRVGISKKNWMADMKRAPQEGSKDTMKIKTKQVGQGRSGKQEKREHYQVVCIKTDKDAVPRYNFHHVEISRNILSPNTMLNFVPHLRDLADNEESVYRRWLENLEAMDKTSGFATLSRVQKVIKTMQKERATTLLLYLDTWLDALAIDNCTKSTLIRHVLADKESDTVTPQQKTSILNSYTEDAGSPTSARTVGMFKDAFDKIFGDSGDKEASVKLEDVLRMDKSVDTIVDSKKWISATPSQNKAVEEHTTVEEFLETYAVLGCLICCSHSCEHGEYGDDNERKRFSIEVVGGLSPKLRQMVSQKPKENGDGSPAVRKARKPCSEECYLNGRPGTRARTWNETETMLLKSFFMTLADTSIPVQCAAAVATGRPCWDVNRQLDKLALTPLAVSPAPAVKVKPVAWYDRHKKMLLGDWQDQIVTHEHQRKNNFDPCNHDGPCTSSNCSCVQSGLLCERFCRCTAATCAYKFTGCACHSLGKTCLPKQKERPCICIQLNRECDPGLCGSCGARERASPRNADNEVLISTGCQNVSLQRGKSRSLLLGKSLIPDCGYGLFAAEDIPADEFVIEYVGELISQDEGVRREARRGDVFNEESNSSYLFTLLETEGIWVDAAIYGNLSRYINHQDDADKRGWGCNITPKILYVNGEYRIKFTSMRDIKAGDELFFNYGENFPNLTKKLMDEQQEEEKKVRRRRGKAKAKEELLDDDEGVSFKKRKGAVVKKRRGRKPGRRKKTFARPESDIDEEEADPEEAPDDEPFPQPAKSRKRKRVRTEDDSEEEEYRPGFAVESQDEVLSEFAGGPPVNAKTRVRKNKSDAVGLFEGPRRGRPPKKKNRMVESEGATPRRRRGAGRKSGQDVDLEDEGGPEPENEEETDEVAVFGSRSRASGRSSGTQRSGGHDSAARQPPDTIIALDSDSLAEDDTPSKTRARRQAGQDAVESSPLSAPDPQFDYREFDLDDVERNQEDKPSGKGEDNAAVDDANITPRRKRGRPKRVAAEDEDGDLDMIRYENNHGARDGNGDDSQEEDLRPYDSDDDNVIDRSRMRKRPARYDE